MKDIINQLKNYFNKRKQESDFTETADGAYQRTRYSKIYTREELKEKMIKDLKRKIKIDCETYKTFLDISTYEGHREKQMLPEVAEYFRSHNYVVDLLNDDNYKDVNVLIINWQNLEKF